MKDEGIIMNPDGTVRETEGPLAVARLLDGTAPGRQILAESKKIIAERKKAKKKLPGLAVVVVESQRARANIARLKKRVCDSAGIYCELHFLPPLTGQAEVIALIKKLNGNPKITGINIHPLPPHINYRDVVSAIDPAKDVEGVHPLNLGSFLLWGEGCIPFTPRGVLKLIEATGAEIAGKRATVVGRSPHVGLPVAFLLMEHGADVTIAHSRSRRLEEVIKKADILVVATGHPEMVTGRMIKEGAVVIDVGSNLVGTHVTGDVEQKSATRVAGWLTPVPGGVGPMTTAMLLVNLLECCPE